MVPRASLPAVIFTLAALTAGEVFAACSSTSIPDTGAGIPPANVEAGSDTSTCQTFDPPSSFNPTAPVVSFTSSVLPIFAASCAFSDCHGSQAAPQGGLYLGGDGNVVYANLVNFPSIDLPAMPRIAPGDPANSFLLHKIDDDTCTLPGCTTANCTELMPLGSVTPLEAPILLTVRAWVAQGAVNDFPDSGPPDAGAIDASLVGASSTDAGGPEAGAVDASTAAGDD